MGGGSRNLQGLLCNRRQLVIPEKEYCCHANVIGYALYAERGKAVMKRISEVSRLAGVSRRTLQYYDDDEVLVVKRSENDHRLYDEEALEKIWQILLYKEMGFELKEIRRLLAASDADRKKYLSQRVKTVRNEIGKLQDQAEFISRVLSHGMPQMPGESEGTTYVESIRELRKEHDWKRETGNGGEKK